MKHTIHCKKLLLCVFVFILGISTLCSDEIEIAKDFIKKAYLHIDRNSEFAGYFLDKSLEYYDQLPEYYYLKNYSLQNNKLHLHEKYKNAQKVLNTIKNAFLIDRYLLLKGTADVFEKNRDFNSAIEVYTILLAYKDRYLLPDYMSFIKLLFNAGRYELLEEVINSGEKQYYSLDFIYYRILLRVKTGTITAAEFNTLIDNLKSNYYDPIRRLYLTALFADDSWDRTKLVSQYRDLKKSRRIPLDIHKNILYNLLVKSSAFQKDDILFLLDMWIQAGGLKDIRTGEIAAAKHVLQAIKENDELSKQLLAYSGVRYKDDDADGLWETLFIYSDGNIGEVTFDVNQDGINEKKYTYYDPNTIFEIMLFRDNENYKKYIFNTTDRSLMYVELWMSGTLTSRRALRKSACYFPDQTRIDQGLVAKTTDYVEEFDSGEYVYTKFNNNQVEYKKFDRNRDNFFEYRQLFRNGTIYEALKDTNADKTYDTIELYTQGKLTEIKTKTDSTYSNYDYKERVLDDGIIKYWDQDQDGLFEIAVIEFNNGTVEKKIDINYDFTYDYIFQTIPDKMGQKTTLYTIKDGKKMELSTNEVFFSDGLNNWTVASTKHPDAVILPDSIQSDVPLTADNNGKHKGHFIFKGKKFFFSESMVKHGQFHYRLYVYNRKIFLFDQTRN